MNKLWLIIPGSVFVIMFIVFLIMLPKPEKIATTVAATPSTQTDSNVQPAQKSVYQNIYDQISGYTPEDPSLSAPNFDRKISLPKEE